MTSISVMQKPFLPTFSFHSLVLVFCFLFPPNLSANSDFPGDFSSTINFTTDYIFRGITQNDENPAVQGSIDWEHEKGIYLGIWGSNVDFNDGDQASTEIDGYIGLRKELNGFLTEIGFVYYGYPGASSGLNYDYYEFYGSVGYDFKAFRLTGFFNYSPEFFADSGEAESVKASLDVPLPKSFLFKTHFGRQWIKNNSNFGVPDYNYWSVGLQYSIIEFDIFLQYIDTDLSKSECLDGCEERVVFSVSRSF